METLKYKVITSERQYNLYCKTLEKLIFTGTKKQTRETREEIALLTLLIEKWDEEHRDFHNLDPVQLLHSLMVEHHLKSRELAEILDVNKSYISGILHYKKGLSKEIIRKLSLHFKLSQEAFNRPYPIHSEANKGRKDEKMMNTTKELSAA